MNTPTKALLSALAFAVASPGAVLAATGSMDPHAKVVTLEYQTGGATADERKHMNTNADANGFDLRIRMPDAERNDSWRDVVVKVTDPAGLSVLNAPAGGPLFYARLPEGDYTVELTGHGRQAMTKKVHVKPGQPSSIDFMLGS